MVIFLLGLFFPTKCYAVFSKYSDNPIISSLKFNSWFNSHTLNPHILFENNTLKLWFTGNAKVGGRWSIGYASSPNGITNWTFEPNFILGPSGSWEYDINFPFVINDNSLYKMWYNTGQINWLSGPDRFRIGYATASNTTSWIKNSHVLFGGDINSWDAGGSDRGFSVIKKDNIFHLWYTATNKNNLATNPYWRIGYATSSDGINWTKHPTNPVIQKTETWEYNNMMYPNVLYEGGKFKMWYCTAPMDNCTRYVYAESTNGYEWIKPAGKNPVYSVPGTSGAFDRLYLSGHTRIRDGDMYKIWYSGFNGSQWSIGYATESADPLPITPTPTPFEPVVIVPGMMASWNKEGILEGQKDPTTPWKLLPFVKEYEGVVQTLKNLGYVEGKNVFLWTYDWRKSVGVLSQQFNQFIDTTVKPNNPGSKIHLVGHSLGGLVTRAWTQSNTNNTLVHHLVTVASPHKGTVQPYKAWEGGDVAQDNSFLSLATRIIIELNRRTFPTTRQVIQDQFPVLKDILPTEPYLIRQINGSLIPIADMAVKNTWLTDLNTGAPPIYPILDTIKGVGFSQTPSTYTIHTAPWLERALGNWTDGKPISEDFADGDSVVTSERASLDDPSMFLSQNHSNVIATSDGVKQILQYLEIPAPDASVVSGQATTITPGLLFLLRSPATLKVVYNGQTYTDFDGIIFIPNATNGTYEATVTGTGPGSYRLAIGQFSNGNFVWKEYAGNTSSGQQTTYSLPYSQTLPVEDPVTNLTDLQRLEEIDVQLSELSKLTINLIVPKARRNLKTGITALSRKDFFTLKKQLEQILIDLSTLRKSTIPEIARFKSLAVGDTLVDAYQAILSKRMQVINQTELNRIQTLCTNTQSRLNGVLETKFNQGETITIPSQLFQEAKQYMDRALITTSAEKAKKYILLFQTQLLFREIGL